ncbi:zinc-binding alcohol dehydrogenase family protein [Thalassobacillus sp. CUG 92003]|uniref:zinc-binding alcohol dehydrogenase family protein n=1 Tax=Thalassobacillus sp. CUG 92003 TaxID=2736641 RepID=UPI0015E65CE8|nr:zinc-binding alcohol dehydrogenase family protein [Thalassobacillus sp. CUG 92003]
MKAIRVEKPHQLRLDDVQEPSLQSAEDVKISVKRMGICGSDMHIYHGENPFATYPRIIGHEIAGEITEIGADVTGLKPGDPVVLEPMVACGTCYACRQNRPNVCEAIEVYGVHREGGGQEVITANATHVHKMDATLSWSEMALAEPFTIGAQAMYRGDVQEGDVVYIIGAGPIGLCCLKMAKRKGARVLISDFNEERLAFAKEWGADVVMNPASGDVNTRVSSETDGMGANVVVDAVGLTVTFEQAVDVASPAGRVVLLGFNSEPSKITQVPITKKEVSIHGSRLQTHRFPEVVDAFGSPEFSLGDLVSHEFSIDDVHEAFQLMEEAPEGVRKVMIKL